MLMSAAGIFSADGLDKATAVMLEHADKLPSIARGSRVVDLGCGWGPIALTLALRHDDSEITAIDVNPLAREITALNASRLGLTNVRVCAPEDVGPHERFDALWSNPPIRIGKRALHAMLLRWLHQLTAESHAALVVSKNLGADSLATWLSTQFPDRSVRKAHSSRGFRLLSITSHE